MLPEEQDVVERFERDIFPFTELHGEEIGEAAMQGDMDAEEIIRRQHMFCTGLPQMREVNLRMLVAALNRWKVKRLH